MTDNVTCRCVKRILGRKITLDKASCAIHSDAATHVTVKRAHLQHLLDVYIENGMVEKEDEEAIEALWNAVSARRWVGSDTDASN